MPRKELGTEQVHNVGPRISTEHTAICGSEDSWTRHGDFAFNSPQWINLSLSCLVTLEPMLILLIYSILWWWGGHIFSILSSVLSLKVLGFNIWRRYSKKYFKNWQMRVDLWPWGGDRYDSSSEDQTNVPLPLHKQRNPTITKHNSSTSLNSESTWIWFQMQVFHHEQLNPLEKLSRSNLNLAA